MTKEKAHTEKPKHRALHHTATSHKKVFDVVPPGKAPAAPNSRSVVPSDKPPVPDDQFMPGAPRLRAGDPSEKRPLLDHRESVELKPPDSSATSPDADQKPTGKISTTDAPAPAKEAQPAVEPAEPTIQPEASVQADSAAQPLQPAESPQPEEPTPGQLAVEQTVEADASVSTAAPAGSEATSQSASPDQSSATAAPVSPAPLDVAPVSHSKSIDDLLAESGAPALDTEPAPSMIVSHHKSGHGGWAAVVLIFLAIVLVAAAALNFLLDAEVIQTDLSLPHTDWL